MLLKHCNRDKSPTRLKITRMKLYCPLSAYSYCLKLEKKGLELIDILKQRQREEKEQAQTLLILKSLPVFLHAEGWETYGGKRGGHAASLPLQLSLSLAGPVTCCGLAKHLHIFGFTLPSRAFSAHCYIFFFPTAASV